MEVERVNREVLIAVAATLLISVLVALAQWIIHRRAGAPGRKGAMQQIVQQIARGHEEILGQLARVREDHERIEQATGQVVNLQQRQNGTMLAALSTMDDPAEDADELAPRRNRRGIW